MRKQLNARSAYSTDEAQDVEYNDYHRDRAAKEKAVAAAQAEMMLKKERPATILDDAVSALSEQIEQLRLLNRQLRLSNDNKLGEEPVADECEADNYIHYGGQMGTLFRQLNDINYLLGELRGEVNRAGRV